MQRCIINETLLFGRLCTYMAFNQSETGITKSTGSLNEYDIANIIHPPSVSKISRCRVILRPCDLTAFYCLHMCDVGVRMYIYYTISISYMITAFNSIFDLFNSSNTLFVCDLFIVILIAILSCFI